MNSPTSQAPVFYSEDGLEKLNLHLKDTNYSKVFILVDSNTINSCLNVFLQNFKTEVEIEIIEMEAGEENKNIETCTQIWKTLSDLGGDRKSLLINLGGGVVTDLGGFIASTFKRGIAYVNIPTTLLAMVDASIGGKTGIDLDNLKNQVGVISQPEMVIIQPEFLATLPAIEMRSGLAEILKHGLIANKNYWEKATQLQNMTLDDLEELIAGSVEIKSNIVQQDPTEKNLRKTLNFGHTLGHAIESYFLTAPEKEHLLHGEAIAIGMIMAGYLSSEIQGLQKVELEMITQNLLEFFPKTVISNEDFEQIKELLKFDKKNSHGNINFVLLEKIGVAKVDCIVPPELLDKARDYYNAAQI